MEEDSDDFGLGETGELAIEVRDLAAAAPGSRALLLTVTYVSCSMMMILGQHRAHR